MRTAFIQELVVQARIKGDVFLVVGDLGYSVVEPFAKEFPDRFLNAGVAEQNMVGVSAGLASEGYHVFLYSIANFPTLRCFEQLRNDVAYQHLSVTVVAVGAGMAYGNLGYSHHAVQDISVMRSLPEMTILSPADPGETRECVQWLTEHPCPSYLRIGKAGERELHELHGLTTGPIEIRHGSGNIALVSTGSILSVAIEAADCLKQQGIDTSVYSCPWVQPVGPSFFRCLNRFELLVVVEEHIAAGGFGSLLRENISRSVKVYSMALPITILGFVGSQDYLRRMAGLTAEAVADLVVKEMSENGQT